MTIKKIGIIFLLFFSLFPEHYLFAQVESAGIIPANIWYSKDPFEEGDKIKIYTVVYNRDPRELSGTVIFFDKTLLLGTKNFTVSPKSIKDVAIDWNVSVGEHTIFAKIENAKFLISENKYEEVYVAENKTEESKRNVSKKIDLQNSADNVINSVANSDTVSNIKKIVTENTPSVVTKTISTTIGTLEDLRDNVNTFSNDKKNLLEKELDLLNKKELENEKKIEENTVKKLSGETAVTDKTIFPKENKAATFGRLEKPFKYVELFFFSLVSFISRNPIVYYSLIVLIIFLIMRFFWRRIFD